MRSSRLDFGSGFTPATLVAMVSRSPSRTAMSTTGPMPTRSSRMTKPVFGEVASADCRVIEPG